MKNFKIMALLLVAAMVMAMSIGAYAASITITSTASTDAAATETTEYTYYEIFKADMDSGITTDSTTGQVSGNGVAYYVDTQAKATAVAATGAFTVGTASTAADGSTRFYVELAEGKDIDDVKTALAALVAAGNYIATGTFAQEEPGGTATADDLDPGYYYITSTLGDKVVVETLADVTINTKNTYPSVTKTVSTTDASAQIGSDVTFTLTVGVPASAADNIVLTDTMTAGLTFKEVSKVNNGTSDLTANTDYTVSAVNTSTNSFTITFPKTTVEANKGKTLTITYVATVNNKAVVTDADTNTVKLDYGNNYESKPTPPVEVNTQEFTFDKIDGSSNKLAGAEFHLELDGTTLALVEITAGVEYRIATSEDATTTTKITTNGNTVKVWGVDGDLTYTLVEDKAPAGFNELDNSAVSITPGTSNSVHENIVNQKGSVLPSTGGIGTTIFYIVGGILVIGTGVILITKRRMSVEK